MGGDHQSNAQHIAWLIGKVRERTPAIDNVLGVGFSGYIAAALEVALATEKAAAADAEAAKQRNNPRPYWGE
jgi:hypothetical protein